MRSDMYATVESYTVKVSFQPRF